MGTAASSGQRQKQESSSVPGPSSTPTANNNNNNNNNWSKDWSGQQRASTSTPSPAVKKVIVEKMSCELCSVNFTIFKRKKCCQECQRYFCSNCLPKPPSSSREGRQCSKCRLMISGRFQRGDLENWKVRDMRCFLQVRNISTKDCKEKYDLIELVIARFAKNSQNLLAEQLEHDEMVRTMAANVRNISFINEPAESSPQATEPASQPAPSHPSSIPSSSLSSSSSSSSSSSISPSSSTKAAFSTSASTTQENSNSSTAAASSTATASANAGDGREDGEGGGGGGRSTRAAEEQEQHSTTEASNGDDDGDHETRDHLRFLLEQMERLRDLFERDGPQEEEPTASPTPIRRFKLDDITNIDQIDGLTVRQLKELLVNNFVDYRGCCEKAELVIKAKLLWKDFQENKEIAEMIHQEELSGYHGTDANATPSTADTTKKNTEPSTAADSANNDSNPDDTQQYPEISEEISSTDYTSATQPPSASSAEAPSAASIPDPAAAVTGAQSSPSKATRSRDDTLCHVCMDSLVDCILLECGHMVTCTQCGKRLADCPICRQYIVRVVRVFRS